MQAHLKNNRMKQALNNVPKGILSSESDVEEEEPVLKRARLEANISN